MEQVEIPKIVIVDSHEIVREGIGMRLVQDCSIHVIAEASDGYGAIKACRQHSPDILLMDLGIVRPSGQEVLAKLKQSNPDVQVIVMSSEPNISNAICSLSAGAVGFIPKQSTGQDFALAVKAALNNFSYIPVELLSTFVQSRRNLTRTGNLFGLSQREIEVLDAYVKGETTKNVAHDLNISVRTVETHRNNIFKKTAMRDRQDLAQVIAGL